MIHIKAKPINYNEKQATNHIKSELNKMYLSGWHFGAQVVAKAILDITKDFNPENYQNKIAEIVKYCNWTLSNNKEKEVD